MNKKIASTCTAETMSTGNKIKYSRRHLKKIPRKQNKENTIEQWLVHAQADPEGLCSHPVQGRMIPWPWTVVYYTARHGRVVGSVHSSAKLKKYS